MDLTFSKADAFKGHKKHVHSYPSSYSRVIRIFVRKGIIKVKSSLRVCTVCRYKLLWRALRIEATKIMCSQEM